MQSQNNLLQHFGDKDHIVLPFELKNGHIVVKVRINGLFELPFVFDTGAEHTLLFSKTIVDLLGYDCPQKIKLYGADLTSFEYADICRDVIFEMAGAETSTTDLVVVDKSNYELDLMTGTTILGLIGGDMMRYSTVRIDYHKRRVHLYKSSAYDPAARGYEAISTSIVRQKPYIKIPVSQDNRTDSLLLLVDTGSPYPLILLHQDSASLLSDTLAQQGVIGSSVLGKMNGYIKRIDSIRIGETTIAQVATRYHTVDTSIYDLLELKRDGIIGAEALQNFDVAIDYVQEQVWLKPRKKVLTRLQQDLAGLYLVAYGAKLNKYIVESVIPDSPADKADILRGDVVLKLGRRKTKHLTLSQITRKLRRRPGKKYRLSLSRHGEKIDRQITLNPY
jgi:hypothetical protein